MKLADEVPAAFLRAEYVHLRLEALDAIKHRTQIIAFALAAVGVLFAGAVTIEPHQERVLMMLIFSLGAPGGLILALLIWLGEFERMVRAGNFLAVLEASINVRVGENVLRWEQWLRAPGNQMQYPYRAAVALLLGPAVAMPIVGLEVANVGYFKNWFAWVLPFVAAVLAAVFVKKRADDLQRGSAWAGAIANAAGGSQDSSHS